MEDSSAILVLERQERELTRDFALRCLEYNISHLHLKPGQFLSEQSVCEQLGLSRTPIREAFSKLANEMLVIIYPQVGTCVAPIRQELVQEARYTRWLLECGIIRRWSSNEQKKMYVGYSGALIARKILLQVEIPSVFWSSTTSSTRSFLRFHE